jgi:hypothetical protein
MTTPRGVWMVVSDDPYSETTYIVFPGAQELEARRWADEAGYGRVAFAEFGKDLR